MRIEDYECIIFDFDGVLTDNCVWTNSIGEEWVRSSRSDGLAFSVLKQLSCKVWIMSTEANDVVLARGKKLGIPVLHGLVNKQQALLKVSREESIDLSKTIYIGNDLNDYHAMLLTGLKVCPSDSHYRIKSIADLVLDSKGGDGIVRELLETHFNIEFLNYL